MTFAVATCPKCSERFRLVWRSGRESCHHRLSFGWPVRPALTASSKLRLSW